jgi:hypothetical protein
MSVVARMLALGVSALVIAAVSGLALAKPKPERPGRICVAMKTVDPDSDGKLDLAEVQKAAEVAFGKINSATLSVRDGRGLLARTVKASAGGNEHGADGTLARTDYMAIVEKLYVSANSDKNNALDCDELKSVAGRALMKLLK